MTYLSHARFGFGKAIEGGTPLSAQELAEMPKRDMARMKANLSRPPQEKSEDEIARRLAQEIDYSVRLLDQIQTELERRRQGVNTVGYVGRRIDEIEEILEDIADIVEAKNQCDAIRASKSAELRKRLLRKTLDGRCEVCC